MSKPILLKILQTICSKFFYSIVFGIKKPPQPHVANIGHLPSITFQYSLAGGYPLQFLKFGCRIQTF